MNQVPLISVLVPLYNHARYVVECLESIAASQYPRIEVLVLDDGSTDDSLAIAEAWRANNAGRFAHFQLRSQTNAGITRTLNRLVASSQGEYLALLASDDSLLPDGLSIRHKALQAHPEWLAVFGDCHVIDGDSKRVADSGISGLYAHGARPAALLRPWLIQLELILRWSVPGPVIMLRRQAFDAQGGVGPYDESLTVEDRDFYLRLLARNALGYVDEPVACYRVHSSNSIRSPAARQAQLDSLARAAEKSAVVMGAVHGLALRLDAARIRNLPGFGKPLRNNLWRLLRAYQTIRVWIARFKNDQISATSRSVPDSTL